VYNFWCVLLCDDNCMIQNWLLVVTDKYSIYQLPTDARP
jgi:hypothetical protein